MIFLKKFVLLMLEIYKQTRILRVPCCRFFPSCSEYAAQSIELHGLFKAMILTIIRILRCHPLCTGGLDEVPKEFSWRTLFCKSFLRKKFEVL